MHSLVVYLEGRVTGSPMEWGSASKKKIVFCHLAGVGRCGGDVAAVSRFIIVPLKRVLVAFAHDLRTACESQRVRQGPVGDTASLRPYEVMPLEPKTNEDNHQGPTKPQ